MQESMRRPVDEAAVSDGRWTPAQAAEFAAIREFRLLQLLSTDRRALAVARRLGHPLFTRSAGRQPGPAQSATRSASAPQRRTTQTQTHNPLGNASQRRSRERAARHREARANAAPAPTPSPPPQAPPQPTQQPAPPPQPTPPLPPSCGERARATATRASAPAAVRSPVRRSDAPEAEGASTVDVSMRDAPPSPTTVSLRPRGNAGMSALREQALLHEASATLAARRGV